MLVLFGDGLGIVGHAVHVEAALRGVVLALELLHSARPALTVEDLGPHVLLQRLLGEVRQLREERQSGLPDIDEAGDAINEEDAVACNNDLFYLLDHMPAKLSSVNFFLLLNPYILI